MPPKRKVETVEDNTEVPPAKKTSEEETPPISPDKGATGETTSSENREAGTHTGLSEEEEAASYKEEYKNVNSYRLPYSVLGFKLHQNI